MLKINSATLIWLFFLSDIFITFTKTCLYIEFLIYRQLYYDNTSFSCICIYKNNVIYVIFLCFSIFLFFKGKSSLHKIIFLMIFNS